MHYLDMMADDDVAVSGLKDVIDGLKTKGGGSNNIWFRYRALGFGDSCTVRFLPAYEDNASGPFWLPKKVIRLKFADPYNVGQDVNIAIPVMQMYTGGRPSDDPILGQVTRLYEEAKGLDDKGETERAKQVRAKASYHYIRGESIAQGFVINPGFIEKDVPENPIRLFELNKQIIKVITGKLETENPEMKLDYWPCHGKKGYNFIIKKNRTGDGKFPKWDDGTGFSMKPTPLSDQHWAALRQNGLWKLETFLPPRPSDDEYTMLTEIVRQSIGGNRTWDSDWEAHLKAVKPYRNAHVSEEGEDSAVLQDQVRDTLSKMSGGVSTTSEDVMASLSRTTPMQAEDTTDVGDVVDTDNGSVGSEDVQSIVNKIKNQRIKTATAGE